MTDLRAHLTSHTLKVVDDGPGFIVPFDGRAPQFVTELAEVAILCFQLDRLPVLFAFFLAISM